MLMVNLQCVLMQLMKYLDIIYSPIYTINILKPKWALPTIQIMKKIILNLSYNVTSWLGRKNQPRPQTTSQMLTSFFMRLATQMDGKIYCIFCKIILTHHTKTLMIQIKIQTNTTTFLLSVTHYLTDIYVDCGAVVTNFIIYV